MRGTASHKSFLSWLALFREPCSASCGEGETRGQGARGGEGFLAPPPELTGEPVGGDLVEEGPAGRLDAEEEPPPRGHGPRRRASAGPGRSRPALEEAGPSSPGVPIDETELGGALLHLPATGPSRGSWPAAVRRAERDPQGG